MIQNIIVPLLSKRGKRSGHCCGKKAYHRLGGKSYCKSHFDYYGGTAAGGHSIHTRGTKKSLLESNVQSTQKMVTFNDEPLKSETFKQLVLEIPKVEEKQEDKMDYLVELVKKEKEN